MSAVDELIQNTLKYMEQNRARRSSRNFRLWEDHLETLAKDALIERAGPGVQVTVNPADYAGMGADKAVGYLVDDVLRQLSEKNPENLKFFQE